MTYKLHHPVHTHTHTHKCTHVHMRKVGLALFVGFLFLQFCIIDHCCGKKAGSQKTATVPRSNKRSPHILTSLISMAHGSGSMQCHSLRILILQYTHLTRQALDRKKSAKTPGGNTDKFIAYRILNACLEHWKL